MMQHSFLPTKIHTRAQYDQMKRNTKIKPIAKIKNSCTNYNQKDMYIIVKQDASKQNQI
jgi:hypothetical protein